MTQTTLVCNVLTVADLALEQSDIVDRLVNKAALPRRAA
jgi:hypothetical protein